MERFIRDIVRRAGIIGLEYFQEGVEKRIKTVAADILTQADLSISEFLVNEIQRRYPDHCILSEELPEKVNPGAQYEWVIDPIDGTYAFAHGIATWAVMLAVLKDDELMYNAVYFPVQDHFFFAEKGKGAFKNDQRIHIVEDDTLDFRHVLFVAARGETTYGMFPERFRRAEMELVMNHNMLRMNLGSSASICYFAAGGLTAVMHNAGMDWDRLPIVLIAQEAGAVVTDSDGNPWNRGRQDVIMANKTLHPKIMELFRLT